MDAAPAVLSPGMFLAVLLPLLLLALAVVPFWTARVRRMLREAEPGSEPGADRRFDRPDLVFALALIGILGGMSLLALSGPTDNRPPRLLTRSDVLAGVGFYAVLLAGVLLAVRVRGRTPTGLFGLDRLPASGAVFRGIGYLLAAYPVLGLAMLLSARWFPDTQPQAVVEFFLRATDPADRWVVIGTAVIFAPLAEEVIFRGYLHGVFRRFAGPGVAALLNSALFAAVHLHAGHFLPLMLLGLALTVAYECSRSLLVPMAMHAVFNAVSLVLMVWGTSAGG